MIGNKETSVRDRVAKQTIDRMRRFTEDLRAGRPIQRLYRCSKAVIGNDGNVKIVRPATKRKG